MPTRPTAVVLLCIAVAVFAAFVPALADLPCAEPTARWILLPDTSVVAVCRPPSRAIEQPLALLYLSLSRGPPPLSLS